MVNVFYCLNICIFKQQFTCKSKGKYGSKIETHLLYSMQSSSLNLPATFRFVPMVPPKKRCLNSFAVNAIQWRHHANFSLMNVVISQSNFSNRSQPYSSNCPFNLPYPRLLACVKCSVLHLQQFRQVLLCTTHICWWHFRFNMDYGWHEMCPLQFLSVLLEW